MTFASFSIGSHSAKQPLNPGRNKKLATLYSAHATQRRRPCWLLHSTRPEELPMAPPSRLNVNCRGSNPSYPVSFNELKWEKGFA